MSAMPPAVYTLRYILFRYYFYYAMPLRYDTSSADAAAAITLPPPHDAAAPPAPLHFFLLRDAAFAMPRHDATPLRCCHAVTIFSATLRCYDAAIRAFRCCAICCYYARCHGA